MLEFCCNNLWTNWSLVGEPICNRVSNFSLWPFDNMVIKQSMFNNVYLNCCYEEKTYNTKSPSMRGSFSNKNKSMHWKLLDITGCGVFSLGFQFCNIEILIKRENTHKIQTNEYYAVRQTDTRIVCESFMSKSKQLCMWVVWRWWWLQAILTEKSPSFSCRPHNWVLYIHTSCMREPPAFETSVLSWVESGRQLKSNKAPNLLYECMYLLHAMIRTYICVPMYCRTFWWDSLQLEKKIIQPCRTSIYEGR
jgi:hypothetical protein